MGCDIHLCAEVRRSGKWERAEPLIEDRSHEPTMVREQFYNDRNYILFTVLAGVRDNNQAIQTISSPRGVPHDVSSEWKEQVDSWAGDGHSHSWLSFRELYEFEGWDKIIYDWDQSLPIKSYCKEFYIDTMKKLASLCSDPSITPDDVRVVFFFDS
jgi:hypothetical protein